MALPRRWSGDRPGRGEVALVDELAQETGVCISGVAQLHGVFFNSGVSVRDHVVVYMCDAEGELPIKSPSLEIVDLRYFAPECLPPDVDPGTERRIQEIAFGKSISRGWGRENKFDINPLHRSNFL